MHRFKIGLLLFYIVMLTVCESNANSSENTEPMQPEVYSTEPDSDNIAVESGGDDDTGNSGQTAQAENPSKVTETDESDGTDTIYLKPCNSYQDILDNVYEVIASGSTAGIVEADELFSSWESGRPG